MQLRITETALYEFLIFKTRTRLVAVRISRHRFSRILVLTRNIVTMGLNTSGKVGVLGDGRAVVVQRRELCGDVSVSWHQDGRQNWRRERRVHEAARQPRSETQSFWEHVAIRAHSLGVSTLW